jgi:hypothetical protein
MKQSPCQPYRRLRREKTVPAKQNANQLSGFVVTALITIDVREEPAPDHVR